MELDLDRQEPGRSELPISGRLALDAGDDRVAEAELRGDLVIESRFLVNGSLEAVGRTTCGRCLQEFDLSWDVPVDLMVLRNVDSDEEEGETLLILQRDGVVDLRESLRECTLLAYPQSPVCREDCRGLCAQCGCDLNSESCDCADNDNDPRWDGLPE